MFSCFPRTSRAQRESSSKKSKVSPVAYDPDTNTSSPFRVSRLFTLQKIYRFVTTEQEISVRLVRITQKEIKGRICALEIHWLTYKQKVDTLHLWHFGLRMHLQETSREDRRYCSRLAEDDPRRKSSRVILPISIHRVALIEGRVDQSGATTCSSHTLLIQMTPTPNKN